MRDGGRDIALPNFYESTYFYIVVFNSMRSCIHLSYLKLLQILCLIWFS